MGSDPPVDGRLALRANSWGLVRPRHRLTHLYLGNLLLSVCTGDSVICGCVFGEEAWDFIWSGQVHTQEGGLGFRSPGFLYE